MTWDFSTFRAEFFAQLPKQPDWPQIAVILARNPDADFNGFADPKIREGLVLLRAFLEIEDQIPPRQPETMAPKALTVNERATLLRQLADRVAAHVHDPIKLDMYLQRLASKFGIDMAAIRSHLARSTTPTA